MTDRNPHSSLADFVRLVDGPRYPWLIVVVGLLVMYVPTFLDLFRGIWTTEDQAHGPIALAVSAWLLYRKGPGVYRSKVVPSSALGWSTLSLGVLLYVVGRSQGILTFEMGSLICVLAGITLLLRG